MADDSNGATDVVMEDGDSKADELPEKEPGEKSSPHVNGDSNSSDGNQHGGEVDQEPIKSDEDINGEHKEQQQQSLSSEKGSSSKRKSPQVVRLDDVEDDEVINGVDEEEAEEEEEDDEVINGVDEEEAEEEEEDDEGGEEEDDEEEGEDDDEEVQEIKDDDSDSDIMEVEAEDPLASTTTSNGSSSAAASKPSLSRSEVKKPQVVTIDDVKTLHALANSTKSRQETSDKAGKASSDKVTIIDTKTILAGRASGVTITPARPASSPSSSSSSSSPAIPSALSSLGSGVTISTSSKAANNSSFKYDQKGKLNDPNLTDDTIVVEAPSFIVPYVYEKPPKEKFEDFKTAIRKLMDEIRAKEEAEKKNEDPAGDEKEADEEAKKKRDKKKKKKKKKRRKRKSGGTDEEDNGDQDEDDEDYEEGDGEDDDDDDDDDSDSDVVEVKSRSSSPVLAEVRKPVDNYFESSLGRFVSDLGMNLVQEAVQNDLLRQQQKRAKKDKSASVMHAIMSLKRNIEQSKENNKDFSFELEKCTFCSFRSESAIVVENHIETPHMRHGLFRCSYCQHETKSPQEVLTHVHASHGVRAKLERPLSLHTCPQCPYEDNMKGKVTRHKAGCDKRYRGERNQEPPHDWEPPAKIPKPPPAPQWRTNVGNVRMPAAHNFAGVRGAMQQFNQQAGMKAGAYAGMPNLQFGPRGRGRPPMPFAKNFVPNRPMAYNGRHAGPLGMKALAGRSLLPNNSSVTIQSISKMNSSKSNSPSISITPLPGRQTGNLRPGQPGNPSGAKGNFVICEICDGYIRDLDQLRNHMQWIHKVKIHPKMIYNRPPLNCQKCQFRFFTDQGLERHLLGSHGLVTASMQDLANKSQDAGRCPVCGKMFQWKLLNHVAKDHSKTLKPAHLSYKCTVCTATFGQYKLFENHVYTAHSGGRRSAGQTNRPAPKQQSSTFKVSDEISIIPQGKSDANAKKNESTRKPENASKKAAEPTDPDVIELDDDEEEIDDDEDEGKKQKKAVKSKRSPDDDNASSSKKAKPSNDASNANDDSGEEGVEEIGDDDADED